MKLKRFPREPSPGLRSADVLHAPRGEREQFVPERDISTKDLKVWGKIYKLYERGELDETAIRDLFPFLSAREILFPGSYQEYQLLHAIFPEQAGPVELLKETISSLRRSVRTYEELPRVLLHSWVIFPKDIQELVRSDKKFKKKLEGMMHDYLNEPLNISAFDSDTLTEILLMRRALFPELREPTLVEDRLHSEFVERVREYREKGWWSLVGYVAANVKVLNESWFGELGISDADIANIKQEMMRCKNTPQTRIDQMKAWRIAADLKIIESERAEITPQGLRLTPRSRLQSQTPLPERPI